MMVHFKTSDWFSKNCFLNGFGFCLGPASRPLPEIICLEKPAFKDQGLKLLQLQHYNLAI